jgi:hypothetical protein
LHRLARRHSRTQRYFMSWFDYASALWVQMHFQMIVSSNFPMDLVKSSWNTGTRHKGSRMVVPFRELLSPMWIMSRRHVSSSSADWNRSANYQSGTLASAIGIQGENQPGLSYLIGKVSSRRAIPMCKFWHMDLK